MKNHMIRFMLTIMVMFLIINKPGFAQDDEGPIYLIRYHKAVMPEGGSVAERDSLIMELVKLHKSNQKVVSVKTLIPYDIGESRDWVIIYEYKKYEDIEAATKIDFELNKKRWPDDVEREMFFQRLSDYFPEHTDQVYMENPKFRQ
jgi:hypothetical protein